MRYAILLGILLIAAPLVLRADTQDPWPDARSYGALHAIEQTTLGTVFETVPAQLLIVIAATILLFILAYGGANEWFILLLITSPAFLVTYTTIGTGAIGTILIAIGGVLLIKEKYWAAALVPVCFILGTNIGILASLVFIVIALLRNMPFVALGVSFFALVSSIALAFVSPAHELNIVNPAAIWTDVLIGGTGGITLFLLALGVLGMFIQYKETREGNVFLPMILIIIAPLFETGNIIVAATLAYTGSIAWSFLVNRDWKFEELGSITMVLIACSLLFTTIVTVRERVSIDTDRIELRAFMRQGIPEGSTIAANKDIAGVLVQEGFTVGTPELPPDPSFMASALTQQQYLYIVTRDPRPPYGHFPVVFSTDSPTRYVLYEVPQR